VELYLHSPYTPSWRCAQLKHRDSFTLSRTFTWCRSTDHSTFSLQGAGRIL